MNNKQLQTALEIATMAHKNVTRRNGDPYIFHACRVANNSRYIRTKLQKTAALLHDVVEDTPYDEQFLIQRGISQEIDTYEAYIDKICTNPDAMVVKLSDLADNLDQGTLEIITERDKKRFITYSNAQCKILATLATDYPELFKDIMTHY